MLERKAKIKRSLKRSLRPNRWEWIGLVALLLPLAGLSIPMFLPGLVWSLDKAEPGRGDVARGAYIAAAAGCATCHTVPGEVAYSGGYAIRTPFGEILASNITPDPIAGIGGWRFEQFRRAMVLGLSPEGQHYYPAFPYLNYKDMSDADLRDLFAHLKAQVPSNKRVEENRLDAPFSFRPGMALWKLRYLEPPRRIEDRGTYLTQVLGHCSVCHTTRDLLGGPVTALDLAGVSAAAAINAGTPNLTPHAEGLGGWSTESLDTYLQEGVRPDGQVSGGAMADVIEAITSKLTATDRATMVAYLRTLQPHPTPK